ncbi:putative membrane protein (plasmid) [Burkholderia thailandensis 34]|uniref:exopolysaccharide Pel transporter PelG n=1 Tax=Burkholderia thailandensis TaxID=57975 RepID=UPI0005F1DDD4|nr:exopolysaccharide Pel transporter PelG [Burkholderia thailandensis]AJY27153.1 putative membrane protein [Burkholderia thailandensis 34]AOJ58510.1 histidine kinase [Burkholderia thailandensis]KXF59792.1 histidine kinase [Burkholderia thailandensis]PNE73159.1 histidine kinase [Burkholderia thailandensis]
MAGIGFELRNILRRDSLNSVARAYVYAGLIGSGPQILSIFGILIIGQLSLASVIPANAVVQFQMSVTYLIAVSLVLTGPFQLTLTRFVSDRLFEANDNLVLWNYNGVVLVVTALAGVFATAAVLAGFGGTSAIYRGLMIAGFVVLSQIWIAVIFLSGVKQYRQILVVFFVGYGCSIGFALCLTRFGLVGLLSGFVAGQIVLLAGLTAFVYCDYHSERLVSYEVFNRRYTYPSLAMVGLLFNVGVWLDKFMFWYAPGTGSRVIGPLYASVIYDIPVFLAYVCVMPGMAAFLVRIEADFVEYYDAFYEGVRNGATLHHINGMRDMMVRCVRTGLYEIVKVQAVVLLLIAAFGERLLNVFGISPLYYPLLVIHVMSASLQVLLLGILNVFFYLDRRRNVLRLTCEFALLNGVLTAVTLKLGPDYYGYGFAIALLIVVVAAMSRLDRTFQSLEYETYMLRRG